MAFDVAGILGTVSIANATYHHMSARGDGNCLFHAAGYLLERGAGPLAGQNRDHAWLRAEVVAWVRTQVTSHALTEPGATIAVHINNLGTDLGGWCGAMATDRTWGDELCVLALEHRFNVRIEVYQLDRDAAIRPANFPAVVSATTLRLLQPPTSQRGVFNHFDPLIDQPTQEERAARRYEAPRAPRMAWACADRTVVRQPWAPAILHAWYPRRWQERSGVSRFFASFTNTNTIDRNVPRVLSIILSTGADGAIRTPAFTAESARDAPPDRAFRAPWQAPLVRKEDAEAKETWEKLHGKSEAGSFLVALDRVDWAAVSVAIRVRAVTAQTLIHFELRGKTGPAYAWSRRWSALKQFASATFASNGEELVSVPANHVVDLLALAGLSWPDSPYQLCAAPRAAHDQDDGAWTYLHVPSEWDVNTLETVGHERVAPLGDRMDHLAAAGATLTPRKDHGDEHRGFTPSQQATTKKVIRCLGEAKSAYDTNIHSVLLKRDNGRYQAVTSWATAVVAVLDVKLGRYVVHSVLYQSAERRLYRIDPAVDGPTADLGDTELKEIESIISALTMYRRTIDDVLTAYDRLAKHQDEEYQRGVIATGPAKTTPKWLAIQSLDAARDYIATEASNRIFERHGVVERRYVDEQTTPGKPICDALEEIISKLQKRQQEVGAALRHVRVTPQLRIEGVGDFDALNPGFGWYQWTPPRDEVIALDRVVTAGISSCAGGVTYTVNKGAPEVMILWHVDGNPSIPVRPLIEQLWPDLEKCPELRTLAYVFPVASELDKYRKVNLYPTEIHDRCDTVFMLRGAHLYQKEAVISAGSDLFGLDLSDAAAPKLIFSHDMTEHRFSHLSVMPADDAPWVLPDVLDDVWGEFRPKDLAAPTVKLVAGYMHTQTRLVAIKQEMADAVLTCSLPIVGAFDKLNQHGTALRSSGFFVGDKGEQWIGHRSVDRTRELRFRTGVVWKPKEKAKEKPKDAL